MINRSDFEVWSTREVARVVALVETERDSYREMLAALPTAIVVVAGGDAVTWANRAFLRLTGLRVEDLRGKGIDQVLPVPGLTERIGAGASAMSATVRNIAVRITTIPLKDGPETLLVLERANEASPPPSSVRAERMDALQAAAGRLAHDLNNPLMIVTGYSEEVLQALPADHPVRTEVTEILEAARRIASVAARLTEFARKNANPPQPVNVTEVLAGLEARLKQAAGVPLVSEPARGAVWALADAGQLEEVILSLASQDCESARGRTRLTIRGSAEAMYACISLRDDGRGLDAAKQAGVFETGLSAKMDSPEAHSGMALARAYNLVRQWGGHIEFAGEAGSGSEYRIYLRQPETQTALEPGPSPERADHTVTILVVDDEAGIRGVLSRFLGREGYRVLEASSAEEALKVGAGQRVDLLLTDAMLPGMQGSELARKLYEADARLKVLYMSGFTPDETVRSAAYPSGAAFLPKPFTLAALLSKVRESLGR